MEYVSKCLILRSKRDCRYLFRYTYYLIIRMWYRVATKYICWFNTWYVNTTKRSHLPRDVKISALDAVFHVRDRWTWSDVKRYIKFIWDDLRWFGKYLCNYLKLNLKHCHNRNPVVKEDRHLVDHLSRVSNDENSWNRVRVGRVPIQKEKILNEINISIVFIECSYDVKKR